MERDVHMTAKELLYSLQFKPGDFGEIALISGQQHRAQLCLQKLENPVKNFTFLAYTFWTGTYQGKKVTVGNGGFYAPDSALAAELLCAAGVKSIVRLGSCGALKKEINIGDYVLVSDVLRGEGTTRYYVDDDYVPKVDSGINQALEAAFAKAGKVHKGGIWSTDAIFRETKEIVNPYIEKGAIAVDMVTSPLVTVANLNKVKVGAICAVSDNLITGQMGFTDFRFFQSEMMMADLAFNAIERIV